MRILTYTVTPEEDGRMVKGILRGSLQLSYTPVSYTHLTLPTT